MSAFILMDPSKTFTQVAAFGKFSTSQETMDNHVKELSTKIEERNTALNLQLNDFQTIESQKYQRGSFLRNGGQNLNLPRRKAENFKSCFCGKYRVSKNLKRTFKKLSGKSQTGKVVHFDNNHNMFISNCKTEIVYCSHNFRTSPCSVSSGST